MNYPDWAPVDLISLHSRGIESLSPDPLSIDKLVNWLVESGEFSISDPKIELIRAGYYRKILALPDVESTKLLGRLITDLRMKAVWGSISKRMKHDNELILFWEACESGIVRWRGAQKLSTKQHRDYFRKIAEHAKALCILMDDSEELAHYSLFDLVDFSQVKQILLQYTNVPIHEIEDENFIEHYGEVVSIAMPSIYIALSDIADKAIKFSNEEPLVRKPNSKKAPIHYFIRSLSKYLTDTYGQPLHEAVATTTEVIFNEKNIDSDYVRKLLR